MKQKNTLPYFRETSVALFFSIAHYMVLIFLVPVDAWSLATVFFAVSLFLFFVFGSGGKLKLRHLLIFALAAAAIVAERDIAVGYSIVVGSAVFLARTTSFEE